jgi:hypothetical protein
LDHERLMEIALREGRLALGVDHAAHVAGSDRGDDWDRSRHLDAMSLCVQRLVGARTHEWLCVSLGLHSERGGNSPHGPFGPHGFPVFTDPATVRLGVAGLAVALTMFSRGVPDLDGALAPLRDGGVQSALASQRELDPDSVEEATRLVLHVLAVEVMET